MAGHTNISWTDHTFNAWWGCTKIAPGCDNCYAAALDKRTGGDYWNPHSLPRLTSQRNWHQALLWNKAAVADGVRRRVFCGSMMDWCDKQAPFGARENLFELIKLTPALDWQLLTKRATQIERCLPGDWHDGYHNVWLGVTCEDRKHGYPRIDTLRSIPAKVRFVSAEPVLEGLADIDLVGIDWLIVGGESGPGCRVPQTQWITETINAGRRQLVPVWFKQWGGNGKDKGGCEIDGREIKQWPMSDRPCKQPARRVGPTQKEESWT